MTVGIKAVDYLIWRNHWHVDNHHYGLATRWQIDSVITWYLTGILHSLLNLESGAFTPSTTFQLFPGCSFLNRVLFLGEERETPTRWYFPPLLQGMIKNFYKTRLGILETLLNFHFRCAKTFDQMFCDLLLINWNIQGKHQGFCWLDGCRLCQGWAAVMIFCRFLTTSMRRAGWRLQPSAFPGGWTTILAFFLTSLMTHVMTDGENWPIYGSHLGPGDPSISPSSGVGCSSLDYPWDVSITRGSSTWDSSSV